MNKFRYWLLAHGIDFEIGDCPNAVGGQMLCIDRHFTIAINHRFFGFDFILVLDPFRGVFTDELNTPHAQLAAERIAPPPEPSEHDRQVREDAEQIAQLPTPTRTALSLMLKMATDGTPRESLSEAAQRALQQFDVESAEVRAELVNMIADFQQQESAGQK